MKKKELPIGVKKTNYLIFILKNQIIISRIDNAETITAMIIKNTYISKPTPSFVYTSFDLQAWPKTHCIVYHSVLWFLYQA